MKTFMIEKYFTVFTWGIFPTVLTGVILFCNKIIKHTGQDKLSALEEICDKKKYRKIRNNSFNIDVLEKIYFMMILTIVIFAPLLPWVNARCSIYIGEMMKKIEVVSSVVIGLTAMAITMSVAIILFDKRYYIVFSIREILQKYLFPDILKIVVICCIMVTIVSLTLLDNKVDTIFAAVRFMILEIATTYNILGVMYILCVIINIMFVDQKKELRLLEQLYKGFWLDRIDTSNFKKKKKWNKDAIQINVDYLVDQYLSICKKKEITQIIGIEFVVTNECYSETWYKKAEEKFILNIWVLMIISTVIDIRYLVTGSIYLTICSVIAIIFNVIGMVLVKEKSKKNEKSLQLAMLRLYSDTCGYYLYTDDRKHDKFIPRIAIRKSNCYDKYIMKMNSLTAFFFLWINYVGKKKKIKISVFEEMIEDLDQLDNKNMAVYLPVFAIGFFLFKQGIKIVKIKTIYNEMVVMKNKQYLFQRMVDSQVFYMTKNFNEEAFEYREMLKKYFEWMAS